MKKIILILLLITLSINYTNAQTGNPDSIKQLLLKDKEDTSRVLHLADLSFEYTQSRPDTTMTLALEALSLANHIGFEKGQAVSLNRIGNAYGVLGNYPKAMEVFLLALQINERINNLDGQQRNLSNLGQVYFNEGDYRLALNYSFKGRALAEIIDNKRTLCIILNNIAAMYRELKIYDSATSYAEQAKAIAYKINYTGQTGVALNLLGSINFETRQNTLALEYNRLSFPYLKEAKYYTILSDAYLDIAKAFEKIQQKDSVLFFAKQSLIIAKERGFTLQMRDAARFLSHYYRKYNADSAFFYQDISKDANDSLFSQEKQRRLQTLSFDEKLRQQELAAAELKTKEERKRNLQYTAIAVALITFIIVFFLLSRSIIVKTKFIEFFGVLGLLAVFEFINLFIHPFLSHVTNDSPVLMLVVLIAIGALLIPLHHKLEKWITKIMVEKNKKIRLAAAKKTIQQLEG